MRFLLFSYITVIHVVAFLKPPFYTPFSHQLFVSQGQSDDYDRVLKLIEGLAKSQALTDQSQVKTDKQLKALIEGLAKSQVITDQSQAKTDKLLEALIDYSSNRDKELEQLIEDVLTRKLKNIGWNVSNVGFTEIFCQDSTKYLEWDGILACKHSRSSKEVLVVIESKQVFTDTKFKAFIHRLLKMKIANKNIEKFDQLRPYKDFLLCGVIASPVIREDVNTSGFTYITLKQDQYEVNLEPTIFNTTNLSQTESVLPSSP